MHDDARGIRPVDDRPNALNRARRSTRIRTATIHDLKIEHEAEVFAYEGI